MALGGVQYLKFPWFYPSLPVIAASRFGLWGRFLGSSHTSSRFGVWKPRVMWMCWFDWKRHPKIMTNKNHGLISMVLELLYFSNIYILITGVWVNSGIFLVVGKLGGDVSFGGSTFMKIPRLTKCDNSTHGLMIETTNLGFSIKKLSNHGCSSPENGALSSVWSYWMYCNYVWVSVPRPSVRVSNFSPKRSVFGSYVKAHQHGWFR